jgi:carboxyl-terminal processing protease
MRRRDLFVSYVSTYLAGPGLNIRSTYGTDFQRFRASFTISDATLSDFIKFVESKGVTVAKDHLKKDDLFIRTMLKATIARNVWSTDAWFQILLETDKQFQKALTLFPEAEKIARLN